MKERKDEMNLEVLYAKLVILRTGVGKDICVCHSRVRFTLRVDLCCFSGDASLCHTFAAFSIRSSIIAPSLRHQDPSLLRLHPPSCSGRIA